MSLRTGRRRGRSADLTEKGEREYRLGTLIRLRSNFQTRVAVYMHGGAGGCACHTQAHYTRAHVSRARHARARDLIRWSVRYAQNPCKKASISIATGGSAMIVPEP